MSDEIQFEISLFNVNRRLINQKPIVINGVSLDAIAPYIRTEIERFPLGTLDAVLVYQSSEFLARYTINDYLQNNIPRKIILKWNYPINLLPMALSVCDTRFALWLKNAALFCVVAK